MKVDKYFGTSKYLGGFGYPGSENGTCSGSRIVLYLDLQDSKYFFHYDVEVIKVVLD